MPLCAAPLRGAETNMPPPRPRGRNTCGQGKKVSPENYLVGEPVLHARIMRNMGYEPLCRLR